MFSGIIDAVGEVRRAEARPGGTRLVVRAAGYWQDLAPGASVAIDGVCLTVTEVSQDDAAFDVVAETLRRSTLGTLRAGGRVNLQKSLRPADRIDGHFVQGHVDAVARVTRKKDSAEETFYWFSIEHAEMRRCIVPKGSVAIDGISLTVAEVEAAAFGVALIPTTLEKTTLGAKNVGDAVNIETDILARVVVHQLQSGMSTSIQNPPRALE